ncbi:penicillin-binding protein [Streptomyces sp. HNM0575]|uniref:transglycosylase domain-containing protein n=1 Tax=Streptomyces sp. HNM0575 TaxID=2716338 RepID=UPI00145D9BA1|nr:transglycosylase domain-containing protein [Streptomyces sp. HNM0575]NLU71389.1 penicillin-binding protein [Streptomyces sp. HNM0575]
MRIKRLRPAHPGRHAQGAARGRHGQGRGREGRAAGADRSRSGLRRLLSWRRLLALALTLLTGTAGAFAVLYAVIDVPLPNEQAEADSNVYLYRDGTRIARTGEVNRESVPLKRVPKGVRYAFVAAEDMSFYDSHGVDPVGMARGVFSTLTGQGTQGGSTITQQYVKNYYLSQERTVTRKVKEMVISLKVDGQETKDDILAGYLNTSYFGRLAYGIQAASRAYYGKDVEDLTVAEGAYLAALVQAPSQYDWAVATPESRKLVRRRWRYVLANMTEMGVLDRAEQRRMRFPAPRAPEPPRGLGGQDGYLVDAANRELAEAGVSEQRLAAGGWTVTLNIDPGRQRALERAADGRADGRADGARDPKSPAAQAGTQTGAVSVSPRSGRVLALYGGRDYAKHYLSNATRTDYQAGAAFAPLTLAAKLEHGDEARTPAGHARDVKRTAVALGMDPEANGFTTRPRTLSLGLMGTSALELAGVYATLGNDGTKVTPAVVRSARRGTESVELPHATGGTAVSAKTARAVSASLSTGLVPGGAGGGRTAGLPSAARSLSAVSAVSGASDDGKAAWYVGSSRRLVTAVGTFGEDPKTREQRTLDAAARKAPAAIWSSFLGEAAAAGQWRPGTDAVPPGETAPVTRR